MIHGLTHGWREIEMGDRKKNALACQQNKVVEPIHGNACILLQ